MDMMIISLCRMQNAYMFDPLDMAMGTLGERQTDVKLTREQVYNA